MLQQSTPEADEQETLPSFTEAKKRVFAVHKELFEKLANTDCDCGHTDDPNHPKRGFCKRKLGGVSVS